MEYIPNEKSSDEIYLLAKPGFKIEEFNKLACKNNLNKKDEKPYIDLKLSETPDSTPSLVLHGIPLECNSSPQNLIDNMWQLTQKPATKIQEISIADGKLIMNDSNCENIYTPSHSVYQANIAFLTNLKNELQPYHPLLKTYTGCSLINIEDIRTISQKGDNVDSYEDMKKVLEILDKNKIYTTVKMHDILVKLDETEETKIPENVIQELETALPYLAFKVL